MHLMKEIAKKLHGSFLKSLKNQKVAKGAAQSGREQGEVICF